MRNILIIGAGFCGTLAAVHLLRQPPKEPVRVILLNRSGLMARGVAYGTRTEQHVLNVPAARMGAFADDEGGFLAFAQQQDARVTGASFLPRALYGRYLEQLLAHAARHPAPGCQFRSMVGEAASIRPHADGDGVTVELDHGETLVADRVILTIGNFEPAQPRGDASVQTFLRSPRYVRDPWRPAALQVVDLSQRVLLLGTGLTMLDVLLDLRARGLAGTAIALSRRGLMPQPHRELHAPPGYSPRVAEGLAARPAARHYLAVVRRAVREGAEQGVDWRDVIGALRAATPALWQALPAAERARFLRHVKPYWEVHRHRCAPELGSALADAARVGALRVAAGRLLAIEEHATGATVRYRARGTGLVESLDVGAVINCTGPDNDTRGSREPLLRQLAEAGHIVPDALGLLTAPHYALVGRNGEPSRVMFYAGPFLRAQHWEATAVPELRGHVARMVEGVRASLAR